MSRVSLSDTGDYRLVNDDQDIRGYNVVDRNGHPVGVVETMVVDTDAELVTSLLLQDGTEIPASDVTIGESVVYLDRGDTAPMAPSTAAFSDTDDMGAAAALPEAGMAGVTMGTAPDYGRVTRRDREHVANVNESFDTDFRGHHEATYGASGRSFDADAEAYRHGYTAAHDDAHRNRPFADAEPDVRAAYPADRDFDADREAVRYGYGRAQNRRPGTLPS